jgi:hypothetical protein
MAWATSESEAASDAESDIMKSRFHSGLFMTLTLNRLWKDCQDHCRAGVYHKWNADLDMLWGELGGDVKPNSEEEKQYLEFNKRLAEVGSLRPPIVKGFDMLPMDYSTRKAKQYEILMEKHLWLKRLQNFQGKGTAYKDGMEDDFD